MGGSGTHCWNLRATPIPYPSFLCFFWKKARKTTKKPRIFYPYRTPKILKRIAIIRAPYKIQNPSEPQNTPRNTPQILLQNRNTEKIRNWVIFVYFSYFFCISVLEGDLGCISGCILGFGGVLYFVWGTYDRKKRREKRPKKQGNPRKAKKTRKSQKQGKEGQGMYDPREDKHTEARLSPLHNPNHLLRLFLASKVILFF